MYQRLIEGCQSKSSSRRCVGVSLQSVPVSSEGALQQTVAATAGRTLILPAEPVHHVTGVSSVSTAQAEVRGAAYSHVADGALEGETLTDGTLSPTSLTATVTAVHSELCRGTNNNHRSETLRSIGLSLLRIQTSVDQDQLYWPSL